MTDSRLQSQASASAASGDAPSAPPHRGSRAWSLLAMAIVAVAVGGGLLWLGRWSILHLTHAVTEDAFVEADLIDLAPRVPGQIVQMLVEDNEQVRAGQLLCVIDPAPYQRRVEEDGAQLEVARADVVALQTALRRLEERVPQQVEFARQAVAVAEADLRSAEHALAQARDTVEHGIAVAEQNVAATAATLEFARMTLERWNALVESRAVAREARDAKKTEHDTALARHEEARIRLAQARSDLNRVRIAEEALDGARQKLSQAQIEQRLAELEVVDIDEARDQVDAARRRVEAAEARQAMHELDLAYTEVRAPFDAVVARRYQFLGDHGTPGVPIFSLYDPSNVFVTANMPETRIRGLAAGCQARLSVDAFAEPFEGTVLWVGRATGSQFALVPRNLTSGEFTKVVQRVPIRILVNEDERRRQLVPGLSVTVAIERGESQ